MKRIRLAVSAIVLATLAACGGGGDGNQAPAIQYSQMVVFGDSLSDVGTYGGGAGTASAYGVGLSGGGKYNINGPAGKNWTELVAAQLALAAPCAAVTGLTPPTTGTASGNPAAYYASPITEHLECYNYAQGGARVTDSIGPGNALTGCDLSDSNNQGGCLGQLTEPVVDQIQRHLRKVGTFSGNELVMVLAGANDVFMSLAAFTPRVTALIGSGYTQTAAQEVASGEAVTAMTQAATDLVGYIKTQMVAKGAKRIAVMTVPDISVTPYLVSQGPDAAGLASLLVRTFNTVLTQGLANTDGVMIVDAYTASQEEHSDPAQYGLTNVTTQACDRNLVATSLLCTNSTLIAGDTSHYLFADGVHPTPYGYKLFAQLVSVKLVARGWL
ncbi:MAG: SGNH/GDSL hydrolase family protein [Burkholderiales bacterium]|nr:SGNH/GDSL hydrolase family protein [Burkholderiales bacterium]